MTVHCNLQVTNVFFLRKTFHFWRLPALTIPNATAATTVLMVLAAQDAHGLRVSVGADGHDRHARGRRQAEGRRRPRGLRGPQRGQKE